MSFAVTSGTPAVRMERILLILDDRLEAEEIAVVLRRRGRDVEVHEVTVERTPDGDIYREVHPAQLG
jgi:hypothetical protein